MTEESPNQPLIIYHKDCFDGMTSAWVAWRYFRSRGDKYLPPIFHPAAYGTEPPDVRGKNVYVLDFSYRRAVLEEMHRMADGHLLILDHHKTAQDDLGGLKYAIFDMERSGAGLTWDWFFAGQARHWLVNTVEDRDLWRFNQPDTKLRMGYIATVPFELREYDDLAALHPDDVTLKGASVLKYIENYGKKAREHMFMMEIGGFVFPTMNLSYQNCSEHLDGVIEQIARTGWDRDGLRAASFFMRHDMKWQFSLRSRGDFDVSAIAKQYGGGGHKNAAGFDVTWLEFCDLMSRVG